MFPTEVSEIVNNRLPIKDLGISDDAVQSTEQAARYPRLVTDTTLTGYRGVIDTGRCGFRLLLFSRWFRKWLIHCHLETSDCFHWRRYA